MLARLLAELAASPEIDVSLSGFGEDEVRDLLRSLAAREKHERVESFDLDEALEKATGSLGPHPENCGPWASIGSWSETRRRPKTSSGFSAEPGQR